MNPATCFVQEKLIVWTPEGKLYFVAADGDNMGNRVAASVLDDNPKKAFKISNMIYRGVHAVKKFTESKMGAKYIIFGGDDMVFTADSSKFTPALLEEMRAIYAKATGGESVTAGVGNSLSEAAKCMTIGKNTGKNKTVYWTEAQEKVYEDIVAARVAKGCK